MLKAMAEKEGFKFVECLTGFKYIGNTALDLVKQGYEVYLFLPPWGCHLFRTRGPFWLRRGHWVHDRL